MNSAYDTFSTSTHSISESVRRDLFNTSRGKYTNKNIYNYIINLSLL